MRRLQAGGNASNASNVSDASAAQDFINEDFADEAVEHGLAAASGAHRDHIVATFTVGQGRRLGEVGTVVVASYTVYVQPDAAYDPTSVHSNLVNINAAGLDAHIDNGMAAMSLDDDYDTTVVSVPDPTYRDSTKKALASDARSLARVDMVSAVAFVFGLLQRH